ncbi:hypothetical protein ACET3Z_022565 [Daucus carota]
MAKKGKGGQKYRRPTRPSHNSTPDASPEKLTGKTLPEDVIVEILSRTPAKSLVRFRCVCKSWLSLTHHPKFIEMHLKRNTLRNKCLLLHGFLPKYTARAVSLFRLNEPLVTLFDIKRNYARKKDYPKNFSFADFFNEMTVCGSVNGIVCLSHTQYPEEGFYVEWGRFVVLWNPAINRTKLVMIPPRKTLFDIWQMVSVGLGFDAVDNDYKIIRLVPVAVSDDNLQGDKAHAESRVEIYSSNKDRWKAVNKGAMIHFYPNRPNCSFIIKGVPYWSDEKALCAIDPHTGMYKNIPHPEYVKNEKTLVHCINMNDLVSVLVYSPGESPNQMVDFYVLDNSGSWMKQFTTGPIVGEGLRMPTGLTTVEGFQIPQHLITGAGLRLPQLLTTGEIVVLNPFNGSTYFYDPKTSHLSGKFAAFQPLWFQSYCHVESLVSVKGMLPFGNEGKSRKNKPGEKNRDKYLSEGFKLVLHFYQI